jgi:hypothetical protein
MSLPSTFHGDVMPAKHSRRKSEMVTLLAELDASDPDFFSRIVLRISEGEFISDLALELKVNYSILRNWVRGNKARETEFAAAEAEGKKFRQQEAMKKIYATATATIEAEPTRADQLRAAEMIIKQEEEKTPMQKFTGDISITFVAAQDGKPAEKVIDQLP